MTILFLPAAVGIMEKFNDIKDYLLPITIIILGAILLNVAVIGLVVQFVKTRYEGDYVEKGASNDWRFIKSYFWHHAFYLGLSDEWENQDNHKLNV